MLKCPKPNKDGKTLMFAPDDDACIWCFHCSEHLSAHTPVEEPGAPFEAPTGSCGPEVKASPEPDFSPKVKAALRARRDAAAAKLLGAGFQADNTCREVTEYSDGKVLLVLPKNNHGFSAYGYRRMVETAERLAAASSMASPACCPPAQSCQDARAERLQRELDAVAEVVADYHAQLAPPRAPLSLPDRVAAALEHARAQRTAAENELELLYARIRKLRETFQAGVQSSEWSAASTPSAAVKEQT